MFRERTDASLRALLMVVASIGLVASIASPIAIRASRAAAQQDYNGSARRHAAPPLIGLSFVANDVAPALDGAPATTAGASR